MKAITRQTKDVHIPKPVIAALDSLEEASGGRMKMVETLSLSLLTQEQELLAGMIADPRNDAKSLARICSMASVSVSRFLTMLGEVKMSKAVLEAQDKVAALLPEVAGDLMSRAVIHTVECSNCAGKGTIVLASRGRSKGEGTPPPTEDELTCPNCRGAGAITIQPDLERQKIALEMAGLLKRGGGVNVAVGVSAGITPALVSTSTFRGATDNLMFGRRKPDSEPVEAEEVQVVEESKE